MFNSPPAVSPLPVSSEHWMNSRLEGVLHQTPVYLPWPVPGTVYHFHSSPMAQKHPILSRLVSAQARIQLRSQGNIVQGYTKATPIEIVRSQIFLFRAQYV